tara:strand:- start:38 stop:274 length:237 start_codon:yes stop_codon:yes gene_type:complete
MQVSIHDITNIEASQRKFKRDYAEGHFYVIELEVTTKEGARTRIKMFSETPMTIGGDAEMCEDGVSFNNTPTFFDEEE